MAAHRPLRTILLAIAVLSAEPTVAAEWREVSADLLAKEKAGYGGLTGVVVHPATGDVYAFVSEQGLYRSTDRGTTWKRHGNAIKGRTEWPGSIVLAPALNNSGVDRFVIATVYGGPIVASNDGGATWSAMHRDSNHVDWVATAPYDPDAKLVLALKHESGDVLLRSTDGGKSFDDDLGKDFGPACVFDDRTAVVLRGPQGKRKPFRTTDAGKTFAECGDWSTRALPQWHNGKVYWLVDGAILTTADKGATWNRLCAIKDGRFGPVFGQNEKHMLVLASQGVVESRDAGSAWSDPIDFPKGFQANSPLTWLGYNAKGNVLYVAQMGAPLFRLERDN